MNLVQPIRDYEKMENMKRIPAAQSERNYILFMVGLYTALRISDILKIRIEHVQKDFISVIKKKTAKTRRIYLHPKLKKALGSYIADKDLHEFLFKSREGGNRPIIRARAYGILKKCSWTSQVRFDRYTLSQENIWLLGI